MNLKILSFVFIITGLALVIVAPSLTTQQSLASTEKMDEKARKTLEKGEDKLDRKGNGKDAIKALDKAEKQCDGALQIFPPGCGNQ